MIFAPARRPNAGTAVILASLIFIASCGGDDNPMDGGADDTSPPAAVTDLTSTAALLRSTAVTLTWTAPGDDGAAGTATSYDIRYSASAITADNFDSGTPVSTPPAPAAAGTAQSVEVTGLEYESTLYFALRTDDDAGNRSSLSNVASTTTVDALLQVTTASNDDTDPSWSPDGSQIAFKSHRARTEQIWVISATGGTETQLTAEPAAQRLPSWSPDGSQIAFIGSSFGSGAFDIWVVPATGGTATQMGIALGLGSSVRLSWSPDGSQIAFSSSASGNNDIWVIPATGGTQTQITTDPSGDIDPSWSPDGSQIAFASSRGSSGYADIWVIPATGGTATQITNSPDGRNAPSWSPDGSRIAFASTRNGTRRGDIWVIPAIGGTATQITTGANDSLPSWSPDGSRVAFASDRSGNYDIWSIAVN